MKKPFPFYPPFLAIFPVLGVYLVNTGIFPIADLWRPLAIAFGAGAAFWLLSSALFQSLEKGALVTAVLTAAFWLFGAIAGRLAFLGSPGQTIVYAGLALGAGWWLTRLRPPTQFLNRATVFLILLSGGQIAWHWLKPVHTHVTATSGSAKKVEGRPPDIFYIILDGYGREDELKKNLNFDNEPFISRLRSLGFYVPTENHSNYCQTAISLASSLNLDYISNLAPDQGRNQKDRDALNNLVNDSRLERTLRERGYTTFAITTGFPAFVFPHADVRMEGPQSQTLFEATLARMTPLAGQSGGNQSMFDYRRKMLLAAFEALDTMQKPTTRPRFVFAHILAPHPPFVFTADGTPRKGKKGPFGYWDGSDFMTYVGTPEDYREGYVGQIQYLNKLVTEMAQALLSTSGTKPIIVLQGDHGSKLHLDQNDISKTNLNECFSNLLAIHAPDSVRERLYPQITPVNIFRVILSAIFGDDLPQLEDRSFYSPFEFPFRFEEVKFLPDEPMAKSVPKGK